MVAMSGGVDSSVAAHLLVEKYRNSESTSIVGLFMQNWVAQDEFSSDNDRNSSFCEESVKDRVDAEKVCRHLNIPLHTANFGKCFSIKPNSFEDAFLIIRFDPQI